MLTEYGKMVASACIELELPYRELAKQVDVSPEYLSRAIHGKARVPRGMTQTLIELNQEKFPLDVQFAAQLLCAEANHNKRLVVRDWVDLPSEIKLQITQLLVDGRIVP